MTGNGEAAEAPTGLSLSSLNPEQLEAVTHDPRIPLQVLAGPGSGKTKVLTSRIAYLILERHISPSAICAVTFTNKAANEMRERLTKMIGKKKVSQVRMGTFHALCALFLRRYGRLVNLPDNFTICSADESQKIVSELVKPHKGYLEEKGLTLTGSTALSMISKAKAAGLDAAQHHAKLSREKKTNTENPPGDLHFLVADLHDQYERRLRRNRCLDFDDLLVYGVELFTKNEQTTSWCKHILVDEFQDTNHIQYQLMLALASDNRATIVGDPDQSIYGWRSADTRNLSNMQENFPGTVQIYLEENYRSTSGILDASLAIVSQDKNRIQKSLRTSHPAGLKPLLRCLKSEHDEAAFITGEIKRMIAQTGGALRWGDFAILLRYNALSRIIESSLQKGSVPNRILGGHKFFDRKEASRRCVDWELALTVPSIYQVKDILAYLQLADNPDFNPAVLRVVNTPPRTIGPKTITELQQRADRTNKSLWAVISAIGKGNMPDVQPPIKHKVKSFIEVVDKLHENANAGATPAELINQLTAVLEFEKFLRSTQPDWDSRWENVRELVTFATEVEANLKADEEVVASLTASEEAGPTTTLLRLFLQTSMLSSEGDNQNEEDNKDRVTITTCHAAKGLEWPVVFVPAVEVGTFPSYRSEDDDEERRLLYVACTRAQTALYLTHAKERKSAGKAGEKEVSKYISTLTTEAPGLLSNRMHTISRRQREIMCNMLGRPLPDDDEVQKRIAKFNRVTNLTAQLSGNASLWDDQEAKSNAAPSSSQPQTVEFASSRTLMASSQPNGNTNRSVSYPSSQPARPPNSQPARLGSTQPLMPYKPPSTNSIPRRPASLAYTEKPLVQQPSPVNGVQVDMTKPLQTENRPPNEVVPWQVISPYSSPPIQSSAAMTLANPGAKRRLGWNQGAQGGGYANKKFKAPSGNVPKP